MDDAELKFPFARELEEQHDALRAAVRWYQSELETGIAEGRDGPREAREFLLVFREQLVQHFRFEELNGFEGGFGSDDPELRRWTQELVRQHHAFELRLVALLSRLDQVATSRELPEDWSAELRALLSDLRRHDAEENALMLWIARGPLDFAREPEPL